MDDDPWLDCVNRLKGVIEHRGCNMYGVGIVWTEVRNGDVIEEGSAKPLYMLKNARIDFVN